MVAPSRLHGHTRMVTASLQHRAPHPPSLQPRRTQATGWPPPDNLWEGNPAQVLQHAGIQQASLQPISEVVEMVPAPPWVAQAPKGTMATHTSNTRLLLTFTSR